MNKKTRKNRQKTNSVNPLAKSSNTIPVQPNNNLKYVSMEGIEDKSNITKISLTVGKKYLINFFDTLLYPYCNDDERQRILEEYGTSLDELLCSMNDDNYLYSINLSKTLLQHINSYSEEELIKLSEPCDVPTIITHLIYHLKVSLPHIIEDIGKETIKKFIAIEPQWNYNRDKILDDFNIDIDSVIIKVNPDNFIKYTSLEKSNECTAFVYGLSLSYLIFINHLYKFVQGFIGTIQITPKIKQKEFTIDDFLIKSFSNLTPLIIGVVNTTVYKSQTFKAQDLIWEMFQLDGKDNSLHIDKDKRECSITFKCTLYENPFINSLVQFHTSDYNWNSNTKINRDKTCRTILLKAFATKEGYLCLKSTMLGLNSILDITDLKREGFYSWVTDKDEYLYTNLHILSKMLSMTKQHEDLRNKAVDIGRSKCKLQSRNPFEEGLSEYETQKTFIDSYVWKIMRKHSFKDITQIPIIDTELIKKFKLEKLKEDYIIIANELAPLDNSKVKDMISFLDHKQQEKIFKMIRFVRKKVKPTHALQKLYTDLLKEAIY